MIIYINNVKMEFEPNNKTLLDFLIKNNIKIKHNCDGNGACGKCQIKLDEEHYNLLQITDSELDILEKQLNVTPTSRLACQITMTSELNNAKIDIL